MRNKSIFTIIVICIMFSLSCEDFRETDLSNSHFQLNAPSNNLVTKLTTLTFWWDSIAGAQSYNLRIVSKSFSQLEKVILDTTLRKTKVLKNLSLGNYQWCVSAKNLNSIAYSDTFSFAIDTAITMNTSKAQLRMITSNRPI